MSESSPAIFSAGERPSAYLPPTLQMSAASGCFGSMRHAMSKSLRKFTHVSGDRLLLPGSFQRFQKRMRSSSRYFVSSSSHIR